MKEFSIPAVDEKGTRRLVTLSITDEDFVRIEIRKPGGVLWGYELVLVAMDDAADLATWLAGTVTQEKQRRTFVLGEECALGDCDCDLWDGLRVLPDAFPPVHDGCDCETVR